MQLFYQEPKCQPQNLSQAIRQAYQIPKGHMPHGAAGAFGFTLPDVYITEALASCISRSPDYAEELREMLKCFYREEYGFVTRRERDNNGETRWLCGSCLWMIGRYPSRYGSVVLEVLYDIAILYLVQEDVSAICQSQYEKFCRTYGHDPREENGWRINELVYRG